MHMRGVSGSRDAELDSLRWHWGSAYLIRAGRGRWRAKRRDGRGGWITAPDADKLLELIRADYVTDPVPRDL